LGFILAGALLEVMGLAFLFDRTLFLLANVYQVYAFSHLDLNSCLLWLGFLCSLAIELLFCFLLGKAK
jgi:hypothetical protein